MCIYLSNDNNFCNLTNNLCTNNCINKQEPEIEDLNSEESLNNLMKELDDNSIDDIIDNLSLESTI